LSMPIKKGLDDGLSFRIVSSRNTTWRVFSFKIYPENMVVQYFTDFFLPCISIKLIKLILYFIIVY